MSMSMSALLLCGAVRDGGLGVSEQLREVGGRVELDLDPGGGDVGDRDHRALRGAPGRLQGAAAVIASGLLPQMEVLAVDGEEPGSVPGAVGDGEGQQAAAGAPEVPRRRQLTVDARGGDRSEEHTSEL